MGSHLVIVGQECSCKVLGRVAGTHQVLSPYMLTEWSCHVPDLYSLENQATFTIRMHPGKASMDGRSLRVPW